MVAYLLCIGAPSLFGQSYGSYDLVPLVSRTGGGPDTDPSAKLKLLDQVLDDLARHAIDYPVHFEEGGAKDRAAKDVVKLSAWLDTLIDVPNPPVYFMKRAAMVGSIGHNLDIPGMAQKADAIFQKWLSMRPDDPAGNQMYGAFLGGVGKAKEAIPFLEKALALGVPQAPYSLGIAYLHVGDKEKATKNLKAYLDKNPDDKKTRDLYDAIASGRVRIRTVTK
ncbi:tetratricopeptide repeat protein [Mesoterricola sediminis]|uniref:tetratricopeptide repeat protein n=1 Tax=Mesoterricola sediminis TaxID=2927980 RepID=UPI0029309BC6|nr:hypothetical protein [Mesoterricola sediminis]